MRKKVTLITGACGEIGHALIDHLAEQKSGPIVTLDLQDMHDAQRKKVAHVKGSITDKALLEQLVSEYEFEQIIHLAALLSTRAEFSPSLAHRVNVEGTLLLLDIAAEQSEFRQKPVQFLFPSSIAAYGMPDLETKAAHPKVKEWEWNYPTTMYGANKLYCERLGIYYSEHFKQLAEEKPVMLDFRSVRFPGLISAFTVPSGGTSDYGPEMLHAAAQGKAYACFVRPDSAIPFMAMPDAIQALIGLAAAPADKLTQRVYNVTAFSLTAEGFRDEVAKHFPKADVTYEPHLKRQGIVDSWPVDTDDHKARKDWGWAPDYDQERCFAEYLVPNIRARYA
ncbi:MAG: NAD-dependent epimerase/dehydratase family protein [Chloroflexi bacterium]|nr:NAD-dependent epimerase/dehydratase family protein [Chloroflexota bacterium]